MTGEGLLRNVKEGRLAGKRSRGRKRIMMLDEFMKGTTFATLKRRAQERDVWRNLTPWTCQLIDRILKKKKKKKKSMMNQRTGSSRSRGPVHDSDNINYRAEHFRFAERYFWKEEESLCSATSA